MRQVTRAALVTSTRTGSSWLVSLLNSHPLIRFHGEIFNLERLPVSALRNPEQYLSDHFRPEGSQQVVGFKIHYHQSRLEYLNRFLAHLDQGRPSNVDWRRVFPSRPVTSDMVPKLSATWEAIRQDGRCRIIHLRRHNLLRQHLSHEIMVTESRARWRGDSEAVATPVTLNAATLVDRFTHHMATVAEIDCFFQASPKLDVFYEDLVADCDRQCARILAFLAAPPAVLRSSVVKREHRTLREAIRNYDEVARALAGTRWAKMLDDP